MQIKLTAENEQLVAKASKESDRSPTQEVNHRIKLTFNSRKPKTTCRNSGK